MFPKKVALIACAFLIGCVSYSSSLNEDVDQQALNATQVILSIGPVVEGS